MPVSLRLPPHVEEQIAEYATRQGLTKTAVILRSLDEFLATHAKPSAFEIYQDVMRQSDAASAPQGVAADPRPRKLTLKQALRRKHAERSARALKAAGVARTGGASAPERAPKTRRAPRKAA